MVSKTNGLDHKLVAKLIELSLDEDCVFSDATSLAALGATLDAGAELVAKEELVVCGLPIINQIIQIACYDISVKLLLRDGQIAQKNTVLANLEGKARELMSLERTILNFLQRMSGVATYTRNYCKDTTLKILDTRKTIPGWRLLDKYSTRVGGASNHRMNLNDLILIKDTHVEANAGITKTLEQVFQKKEQQIQVEVEVRNLSELKEALNFPIDMIMLDNFSDDAIKEALLIIRDNSKSIIVEASGGITKDRLNTLNALGVDCVSVGALTTKATNADISMYTKLLAN
jgi:nicotinate-nucleotide pyrophosphorylase (carboxylating)